MLPSFLAVIGFTHGTYITILEKIGILAVYRVFLNGLQQAFPSGFHGDPGSRKGKGKGKGKGKDFFSPNQSDIREESEAPPIHLREACARFLKASDPVNYAPNIEEWTRFFAEAGHLAAPFIAIDSSVNGGGGTFPIAMYFCPRWTHFSTLPHLSIVGGTRHTRATILFCPVRRWPHTSWIGRFLTLHARLGSYAGSLPQNLEPEENQAWFMRALHTFAQQQHAVAPKLMSPQVAIIQQGWQQHSLAPSLIS